MRFCDYCGDELTGDREAIAFGHSDGHLRSCTADEWFYYCDGECTEAVRRTLKEMARWANLREGSGLTWRLEAMPGAKQAPEQPSPTRSRPVKGKAFLDEIEIHPRSASALRGAGIRTLEEASERSEIELLGIEGIGATTIRQIIRGVKAKGLALRAGPSPEEFGKRIRRLREAAGLRRDEVARGIDPEPDNYGHWEIYASTITEWEAGRRVPTGRQIERLAAFFTVPIDQLTERAAA